MCRRSLSRFTPDCNGNQAMHPFHFTECSVVNNRCNPSVCDNTCILSFFAVGTVMAAREILIIVLGPRKAHALQKCIEEGVNHMYTASTIQLHRRSCIVCDEDATLDLKVRTVRYFKGVSMFWEAFLIAFGCIDNVSETFGYSQREC